MKKLKNLGRRMFHFTFFYIIITLSFGELLFSQKEKKEEITIKAIPVSNIATSSVLELQKIHHWREHDIQKNVNSSIKPDVDTLIHHAANLKALSNQVFLSKTNFSIFKSLTLRWESIKLRTKIIQDNVKQYSTKLESIDAQLKQNSIIWDHSLNELESALITAEVKDRIAHVQSVIDSTRIIIADSLSNTIILQNKLSDITLLTESYIENIAINEKKKTGELLLSQEDPLWNISAPKDTIALGNNTSLLHMGLEDSKQYVNKVWPTLVVLLVIFFGLIILLNRIKLSNTRDFKLFQSSRLNPQIILKRKLSSAFILTMLFALWWLPERPILLKEVFSLLFLTSFLDLYIITTLKRIRHLLPYLYVLFIFSVINEYLQLSLVYDRLANLFESIALLYFHIQFFIIKRQLRGTKTKRQLFFRLLNTVEPLYFIITSSAIVANVIGFNYYAKIVNDAVLFSLILLLVFGTAFFAFLSFMHILFGTEAANQSFVIKAKKEPILRWLFKFTRVGAVIMWGHYTLKFFLLSESFMLGLQNIMLLGYNSESWSINLGNVIHFVVVIYLSWLIANIISTLLRLELFRRVKVPRGVPLAVSSLTQYFVIILGCMIGLSLVGFNLQNLSLLAGALGVGIGFGLQNIVNNFISGLILAFERPVTAGDIVIVAGNEGIVQKIGIRASIIKQWDGSEIIVPNADLISKQVTNWSLEAYKRRIILPLATPLNTDADQVLTILAKTVSKVDNVLANPECKVYFNGIKENKMGFSVYYWVSDNILDCKSRVNIEVRRALNQAGITQLTPVHVLMDEVKS